MATYLMPYFRMAALPCTEHAAAPAQPWAMCSYSAAYSGQDDDIRTVQAADTVYFLPCSDVKALLSTLPGMVGAADAMLMDLGVSSMQVSWADHTAACCMA
jgi:hypothetical protein